MVARQRKLFGARNSNFVRMRHALARAAGRLHPLHRLRRGHPELPASFRAPSEPIPADAVFRLQRLVE